MNSPNLLQPRQAKGAATTWQILIDLEVEGEGQRRLVGQVAAATFQDAFRKGAGFLNDYLDQEQLCIRQYRCWVRPAPVLLGRVMQA